MSDISTFCPRCRRSLEIPFEFDNVICPGCGAAYRIRRHGDLVNLTESWSDSLDSPAGNSADAVVESRLAEIDELVDEAELEIESLRAREQSVPLQMGCAIFGLFTLVLAVIAVFMLVGREHVGGWLFYVSVAVVVLLGLARIRRKLVDVQQLTDLRRERARMESGLWELREERDRIQTLRANLHAGDHQN